MVRSPLVISAVAPLLALLLVSLLIFSLAPSLGIHFERHLGRTHLPLLTSFLLKFAPSAPLFAGVVVVLHLAAAFLLLRAAPSPEAGSTRLLLLNTTAWVVCFLMLAVTLMAVALPIIKMTSHLIPR